MKSLSFSFSQYVNLFLVAFDQITTLLQLKSFIAFLSLYICLKMIQLSLNKEKKLKAMQHLHSSFHFHLNLL